MHIHTNNTNTNKYALPVALRLIRLVDHYLGVVGLPSEGGSTFPMALWEGRPPVNRSASYENITFPQNHLRAVKMDMAAHIQIALLTFQKMHTALNPIEQPVLMMPIKTPDRLPLIQ